MNKTSTIYYFAYGMLTDPELMNNSTMIGKAQLLDYSFEFAKFANVYPNDGGEVFGTLWQIDRDMLTSLDQTESYPFLYTRHTVTVYSNNMYYNAQVYVMTDSSRARCKGFPPSDFYLERLFRGYDHANLPLSQIHRACSDLELAK